ncbi:hypothetical protein CHS0354_020200 [Potamilus streckersoni]|uniref:Temptin Cys/Cys disulfide domain-containing protein n=1 Tax=Potamilus streckersoni TaxID=2493646 RepID=A0AAE0SL66_9BIVA|nr:hypothetical protein CHS0354_020200 [Potamilus streckersoni]
MLLILILINVVGVIYGRTFYRDSIPNGHSVPNMCYGIIGGRIWAAVGHYDPDHHTQSKNPFALDFAAAHHVWTQALCMKDSDRDGKTNGEELGDPHCTWNIGGPAPIYTATGHPGICEPIGSQVCSNQRFYCGCHDHACVA